MKSNSNTCPYCNAIMKPVKMACSHCEIAVEGQFDVPLITLLSSDEAELLSQYVLSGFSIKDMEKRIGLSYPAVRARLDRIIESMKTISATVDKRREILDRVERGELKPDEAIRILETL